MKLSLALLSFLVACHTAYAAELFGTVDAISGSAVVVDQSGKSAPISSGQNIYEGQTISSGPDGEVHLVTEDGGIIAVRPDTVFRVDGYKAEGNDTDKIFMSLLKGTVRSITGWVGKFNHSAYRINTPTATIGIRGTDHETTVIEKGDGDEPGTYDHVNEGSTVLNTPHGSAEVVPGKFAFAPRGRAVAPVFLTQQPRFLAMRRLRIEDRIQRRKEFFHERLHLMREERIRNPRSIQGNRLRPDIEKPAPVTARRKELREHHIEQARQNRQERRANKERGRDKNPDQFKGHERHRKKLKE